MAETGLDRIVQQGMVLGLAVHSLEFFTVGNGLVFSSSKVTRFSI
jgi:hypothetical protein